MAGEQTIADQAHAAAVQMWQETGSGSGSRPRREDFDHLDEVPSLPTRLPELPPADPDEVQAALAQMQASSHGQIVGRR